MVHNIREVFQGMLWVTQAGKEMEIQKSSLDCGESFDLKGERRCVKHVRFCCPCDLTAFYGDLRIDWWTDKQ